MSLKRVVLVVGALVALGSDWSTGDERTAPSSSVDNPLVRPMIPEGTEPVTVKPAVHRARISRS